jgi:hypothetical protein
MQETGFNLLFVSGRINGQNNIIVLERRIFLLHLGLVVDGLGLGLGLGLTSDAFLFILRLLVLLCFVLVHLDDGSFVAIAIAISAEVTFTAARAGGVTSGTSTDTSTRPRSVILNRVCRPRRCSRRCGRTCKHFRSLCRRVIAQASQSIKRVTSNITGTGRRTTGSTRSSFDL